MVKMQHQLVVYSEHSKKKLKTARWRDTPAVSRSTFLQSKELIMLRYQVSHFYIGISL